MKLGPTKQKNCLVANVEVSIFIQPNNLFTKN
jgi:hypothetical protein